MKLEDINESGNDPMDTEPHSRTTVGLNVEISFAHESGLEEAFKQLVAHGAFRSQLEIAFAAKFKEVAQKLIMSSSIPPGHGWMDDLETEVMIDSVTTNSVE